MIQLFDLKMNNKSNDNELLKYKEISNNSIETIVNKLSTSTNGLNEIEAIKRLQEDGLNVVVSSKRKSWITFLLNSLKDSFIIVLFILAIINFLLGDKLGSFIIIFIALISAFIRFIQDYSVYKFNLKLKEKLYSKANVIRDSKSKCIKTDNVVIGDVVTLSVGAIIPADIILFESKDFFINQSIFTGESIPVEKSCNIKDSKDDLANICFMGCSVISGEAKGIVINTGLNTYLGNIGQGIDNKKIDTNFDKGMKSITKMLIIYMITVCAIVLIVDGLIKNNFEEALLFALSVAVGITPSMLPMIVNVNLTKGSKVLAKKKTLVKRIEAIQNLGAIDILCTDKTGTLTEYHITLQKYIDVTGKENINILEYAYLNSYFSTGIKNLVDRAILSYAKENKINNIINNYEKIDEIPFDYNRRLASVIVKQKSNYRMLTKGALESILKICDKVLEGNKTIKINKKHIETIEKKAQELEKMGMQVIAIAEKKEYKGINIFSKNDESSMTFIGFVAFLDPPKTGVKKTLSKLKKIGINIKILTGDNQYATRSICKLVGLKSDNILIGDEIDKLTDEELRKIVENIDVFARLNPSQKERVLVSLKNNGHTVGYMGDGVNDAPALHQADIGISVNTATDIAKEASDIIILEKNLNVIYDGVIEGRKVYGNIIKYMKMALSADFGDVFSIMIASIFLPFLPLLPIQMLLQDFIYDFSQIGIPYDNVDIEFLTKPRKWDTKGISRFMKIMGLISSIIDVLSFIVFWFILKYNTIEKQAFFQTAWFVMCLISELLIIHNVRTAKKPFIESCASKELTLLTILSMLLTIIMPIILCKMNLFNFVILPIKYYFYMILLILLYLIIVNLVKNIYIKKYNEWL